MSWVATCPFLNINNILNTINMSETKLLKCQERKAILKHWSNQWYWAEEPGGCPYDRLETWKDGQSDTCPLIKDNMEDYLWFHHLSKTKQNYAPNNKTA